jgi:peptidoglycan hydrolase CwlO-like protein
MDSKYVDPKRSIESLNNVILELQSNQIVLDDKIINSGEKIDSLSQEIVNTKIIILNTKNYYDKKIRDIRTYTPTQLDKFFADRYKQVIY